MGKLKYLFEAEYYDGKIYKQNEEDTSIKFPPTIDENGNPQGKSAGADIQEDLDNNLIKKVSLVSDRDRITVDLTNGTFLINGLPMLIESEHLPVQPDRFKLLRFYIVDQSMNVKIDLNTKEVLDNSPVTEFRRYFLGWECTIAGKVYTQKIAVA